MGTSVFALDFRPLRHQHHYYLIIVFICQKNIKINLNYSLSFVKYLSKLTTLIPISAAICFLLNITN
ncbi:MAG: hypothetical protein QG565_1437 [Campylobacterota bacterium]|nr:hypothetical protein [Campylobacterota bacterium]